MNDDYQCAVYLLMHISGQIKNIYNKILLYLSDQPRLSQG